MKPFLGIDLTTDRKNEQINGSEFLVQTPSSALSKSLEDSMGAATKTVEKSKLPLPFRILQYLCGLAALFIAGGMAKADVSFAEGYQNAPALYWIGGVSAVIWLILWLWSRRKSNTVLGSEDGVRTLSHVDGVTGAIERELGVPENAKEVDVLALFYKVKDGTIKVHTKGLQIAPYLNPTFKIFSDDENLYLVHLEGKYAFPLSSIGNMHTVKKHIRINQWNKEEKLNKGIYKQYKLTRDNYGCVHCKYYHILEVSGQSETYGIYIPCYELPVFEKCLRR